MVRNNARTSDISSRIVIEAEHAAVGVTCVFGDDGKLPQHSPSGSSLA